MLRYRLMDRHKDANSRFPQFFVRSQRKMYFLDRFSKIHQTFRYKLFSAEGQTEKGTDTLIRGSQFLYAVTNSLHIYISPAKFLAFLQTVRLYTAARSLSDADSRFFPKQYNSSSCNLVNVCTTAQQYTGT